MCLMMHAHVLCVRTLVSEDKSSQESEHNTGEDRDGEQAPGVAGEGPRHRGGVAGGQLDVHLHHGEGMGGAAGESVEGRGGWSGRRGLPCYR